MKLQKWLEAAAWLEDPRDASSASSLRAWSYGSPPCCLPSSCVLPLRPPPLCSGYGEPRSWRWVSETWLQFFFFFLLCAGERESIADEPTRDFVCVYMWKSVCIGSADRERERVNPRRSGGVREKRKIIEFPLLYSFFHWFVNNDSISLLYSFIDLLL